MKPLDNDLDKKFETIFIVSSKQHSQLIISWKKIKKWLTNLIDSMRLELNKIDMKEIVIGEGELMKHLYIYGEKLGSTKGPELLD